MHAEALNFRRNADRAKRAMRWRDCALSLRAAAVGAVVVVACAAAVAVVAAARCA
jgi:hypothetical protein